MTQIKTALVSLLSKFTVELAPDTECEGRVKMNPRSFAIAPERPLKVTFVPRSRTMAA